MNERLFFVWVEYYQVGKCSLDADDRTNIVIVLLGGAKGPGLFCILPCVDTMIKVDLRTATFNVPPQEVRSLPVISPSNPEILFKILTRDSVTVSVDAVVYSRVFNPVNMIRSSENISSFDYH